MADDLRQCRKCGEWQALSAFPRRENGKHKRQCRACQAAYMRQWKAENPDQVLKDRQRAAQRHVDRPWERKATKLRLKFGMSLQEYEEMLSRQGGVCAICGGLDRDFDKRSGKRRDLSVDHDHALGRVRGLLCGDCNRALGLVRESPATLAKMIAYLRRHTHVVEVA